MDDLLITNAVILDGTGGPGREGSVAVSGDRIRAVGGVELTTAKRVIDARGLAVSPGFVDIHGHSDYYLLIDPRAASKVRQGVTTEVGGNCGYSPAPIAGEALEERRESYRTLHGLDANWTTLRDYYGRIEAQGLAMNFATLVGHNTVRASAMGWANRPATSEEIATMAEMVRAGMADGALGLSTGLVYSPACFAPPDELQALAAAAAGKGGILTVHMRSESAAVVEAVTEAINASRAAQIPLQISHLKTAGKANWAKLDAVFNLIEAAQTEGLDVTCDRYPYIASHTSLDSVLPNWVMEGGPKRAVVRLQDAKVRRKIREEFAAQKRTASDWDRVMIAICHRPEHKPLEGLTLLKASQQAGTELYSLLFNLLVSEAFKVEALFFSMDEGNLRRILAKPYCMIGSDAGARATDGPLGGGHPHPRGFGTYPRVLGHYVREERVLDLPVAIKKMTLDPCRKFGLADRGVIREGAFADLVLFDPDRIADNATYDEPVTYPTGIKAVIVNGLIVVDHGEAMDARPGRVLRRTGFNTPRPA